MRRAGEVLGIGALLAVALSLVMPGGVYAQACSKPVYLTLDTGHMGVADHVAEVLRRHKVPVTFFAADERTQVGDGSLGQHWAPWWRARAEEGHEFASHTLDHVYWRADVPTRCGVRRSIAPRSRRRASV